MKFKVGDKVTVRHSFVSGRIGTVVATGLEDEDGDYGGALLCKIDFATVGIFHVPESQMVMYKELTEEDMKSNLDMWDNASGE
jgi:hypothetical protein